jgi:hypothetical protein
MINNVHARKPLRRSVSADCDTKVWTQKKAVKKNFIAVKFRKEVFEKLYVKTTFVKFS